MQESINFNADNLPEEYAWFVLFYLVMKAEQDRDELWDAFEQNIIYNNRFSADNEIIDEIHIREKDATTVLKKESYFYRARTHHNASIDKLFKYYLKEQGKTDREIKDIFNNLSEFDKTMKLSFDFFTEKANDGNDSNTDKLLKAALKKWKNNVKFKGYNAKDLGAPEADRIKNGRANPDHIRYLYVSEDVETPIYEIRPKIGENVSIARAKLTRDAVIYDLPIPSNKPANSIFEEDLIHSIGSKFSQPISGNDAKYIPTQYLAEEIKKMGFDGIRYSSSVHKSGNNIVFFDPEICKMVSSDLYTINNINIDFDYHYLYHIDEPEENIENSIV